METTMIKLTRENCTAQCISQRNNVMIQIVFNDLEREYPISAVMHKKYFNLINSQGHVDGRLRQCEDGLIIFEGFSFK